MNCEEFRRRMLEDPERLGPELELEQHVAVCERCAEEHARALEFEDSLLQALQVDVPEELNSRVVQACQREETKGLFNLQHRWFPAAASLLLVVALAGWMGFQWGGVAAYADGLSETVLDHIEDEIDHLHERQSVSGAELAAHLSRFGAVLVQGMGDVDFASPCWIRKQMGLHLVISEQQGPVTVLLMPGEYVREREAINAGEYTGVILPTGYGSMAVVGYKATSVNAAIRQLQNAVIWGV